MLEIFLNIFELEPTNNYYIDMYRVYKRIEYDGLDFAEMISILQKNFVNSFTPIPFRSFGVEIEGGVLNKYKFKEKLIQRNIPAEITDYNRGKINPFFAIGTDSSLKNIEGDPIELTSPRLIGWGPNGIETIKIALEEWNQLNPHISTSCGIHVHVNTDDFTINDILKLIFFTYISQPFLFGITPTSRWDNDYCIPLFIKDFLSPSTLAKTKYKVLNIKKAYNNDNNDSKHVEFRVFPSSTDFYEVEAYTLLSLSIVETVKKKWDNIIQFLVEIDLSSPDTLQFEKWLDTLQIKGVHPVKQRVRSFLIQKFEYWFPRYNKRVELHRASLPKCLDDLFFQLEDNDDDQFRNELEKFLITYIGKNNLTIIQEKISKGGI